MQRLIKDRPCPQTTRFSRTAPEKTLGMFWVFSEQTAVFQMLHHIQCMLIFLGNSFLYFKHLTFRQLCGGIVLVPKAGDAPLHSSCMAAGVIGKEHLKHGHFASKWTHTDIVTSIQFIETRKFCATWRISPLFRNPQINNYTAPV